MTRRLLISGALIAVAATACSAPELAEVDFGEGRRFIPAVTDAQDDVGLGSAVAVAEDGTTYVSYMAFAAELQEGQIAQVRPIGSPFLPAVALTSITPDGLFTRGAVLQDQPEFEPAGVEPPFRPEKVEGLDLDADNTNGTDVAVSADGAVHVVWAAPDGIYHAATESGGASTVEQVYALDGALSFAGPLGRPSVALDDAGTPWVAFGVNGPTAVDIVVARPGGEGWDLDTVATTTRCNGCPPPLPTGIAVAGGAPVVVFADPAGGVRAARGDGGRWVESEVDGALAAGLDAASDGDTVYAAYYSEAGSVVLATLAGGTWSTADVAEAPFPTQTSGLEAATTGVAAAGGTVAVAWQDDAGVHLATGAPDALATEETSSTEGGITPSVSVATDGTVVLSWVDPEDVDLLVGVLGDPESLVVANPSPVPTVSMAPVAPEWCGDEGVIDLEISGSGSTFVDGKNCLVAPAGEEFTILFDNLDGTHNIEVWDTFPSEGGELIDGTEIATGPIQQELPLGPLDEADYYFQCVVHSSTMTGTLAVVAGAK